jgi:GNAT superfamily N-acetyltransferase
MSDVATLRSTSGTGFIRALKANEQHLLGDHLLRLEPASRRDRFNGGISDEFINAYATRCFDNGATVIAYLQDGVVRGAVELHRPERSADGVPEIAFSVESRVRRQGVGSALFEQALTEARRKGYRRLRITTNGENQAMKALAYKFGAHLTFRRGEATGTIDLTRTKSAPEASAATSAPKPPEGWGESPNLALSAELLREMFRSGETLWRAVSNSIRTS